MHAHVSNTRPYYYILLDHKFRSVLLGMQHVAFLSYYHFRLQLNPHPFCGLMWLTHFTLRRYIVCVHFVVGLLWSSRTSFYCREFICDAVNLVDSVIWIFRTCDYFELPKKCVLYKSKGDIPTRKNKGIYMYLTDKKILCLQMYVIFEADQVSNPL